MSEKTHQPTARHLREARKRGEVVHSAEVSSGVSFVVVVVALWLLGSMGFSMLRKLWRHATSAALLAHPADHLPELLLHMSEVLLWGMVPVLCLAGFAGFAGSFFQVGGLAAWSRLAPDANRLNPAQGLKRIFSTGNLVKLLKMVIKTLLIGALMFVVIRGLLDTALKLGHATPSAVMAVGAHALLTVFGWAAVIYVLMAAIDYVHEHHEFTKKHRMSIEDLRREHKEAQGDPATTGRRRSAQYEAAYAGLADRVRWSSAVIHSNTTAVALQYLGEKDLPRVIARGEGAVAAQIRRFAQDALVPTEFDASLAALLYAEVPLGQTIPRSLYAPVAALLRWAQGRD